MRIHTTMRSKIITLIGTLGLMGAAAFPLMGMAQDASPAATPDESSLISEGEMIYTNVCIACHQPDGKGVEGIYPALDGNPLINGDDPTYFVSTVLTGRGGMPTFANIYSDEEIAAVTTFVRQNWSNDASMVSPEQVAEVRKTVINEQTLPGQRHGGGNAMTPEAGLSATPASTPAATP